MVAIATFERFQPIRAQSCRRRFSIVTRYAILHSASVELSIETQFALRRYTKWNFGEMNSQSSRNETAAATVNGSDATAAASRDRKTGGGVLKRLKSRRNQADRRPVTEEELRALGRDITPDEVLGLRAVTRGKSCGTALWYLLHLTTLQMLSLYMCYELQQPLWVHVFTYFI